MRLTNRPRLRGLIARGARHLQAPVGGSASPAAGPASERSSHDRPSPQPDRFARELPPGRLACERDIVTRQLFERLGENDVAEVERKIAEVPALADHYATAPTAALRGLLVLAYGLWLGVPAVSEKTGLSGQQPPDEVHAMARGPLAAAGGLYEADLVADALAGTGSDIADAASALDFGCSSGRVVRVLSAAYPDTEWHGCDPNAPAITWASEAITAVNFFPSGDAPPLALDDASLDLAYAISIWSHFEPELGRRWFDEMHRLIRPGGHLVCTTHGFTSVCHYATRALRTPEQSQEIVDSLYRRGTWYAPEFGEDGDWGVVNPDWGTAFLSPEWMLAQLCPQWRVLEFASGRNQENQDVYVLQRV